MLRYLAVKRDNFANVFFDILFANACKKLIFSCSSQGFLIECVFSQKFIRRLDIVAKTFLVPICWSAKKLFLPPLFEVRPLPLLANWIIAPFSSFRQRGKKRKGK